MKNFMTVIGSFGTASIAINIDSKQAFDILDAGGELTILNVEVTETENNNLRYSEKEGYKCIGSAPSNINGGIFIAYLNDKGEQIFEIIGCKTIKFQPNTKYHDILDILFITKEQWSEWNYQFEKINCY